MAYRDLEELDGFLEHLAREVYDAGLRGLLDSFLDDAAFRAELRRAPCTRGGPPRLPRRPARAHRGRGHAGAGDVRLHPRLDSDLLITAALLHDIGKTREFELGAEIALQRGGRADRAT